MKQTKRKTKCSNLSIRWKLAFYFSVFVAISLFTVGCLQILLLDFFFEHTKKATLTEVSMELSEMLIPEPSQTLEMDSLALSAKHNMSILIYKIEKENAVNLVSTTANGKHSGFLLEQEFLSDFYEKASSSADGVYQTKVTFGGQEVLDKFFGTVLYDDTKDEYVKIPSQDVRIIQVKVVNTPANESYVLFLHTALLPMDSTVFTLRLQFNWIAVLLILVSLVMVLMLYRKISKPLIQMNEAAKQLATGQYDVSFVGEGFLEARELAMTLNYASEELSKSDKLQKDLIANISHDLRTPLTMIRGYAEMMRDIPDENTSENLQMVIDETDRLSLLVNDLLDLSKIQSGTQSLNLELFDLNVAMSEVMQRYEAFTKHRGYKIEWKGDSQAFVFADRSMILQVIYNMTNNAINYTGSDKCVTVSQYIENGRVRMSFADTGVGIPQDQVSKIWDRYYKIDAVHKQAAVGTGLGLSIVKEILQMHGAAYGVNSTIGKGSVFWFELPLCSPSLNQTKNDNNGKED